MKKRIMVVLLSTAMVASLAIGCGSNSKSDDTKSETKTEEKADTKEETKDVESVEQRTVYVTPEWLKSAQDGNQEGYEDVVVAEVAYGDNAKDKVANDDNFKLVSIRSEDEWLGKTSGYNYMDKAGEPDGAVWGKGAKTATDVADFTNDDGTVKDLDGFKEVWKDCDFTLDNHLAFYCGTGWRATVPFLVLYENGYDNISVYDGGWYEWLMHDDYPVQVGDPASDDCVHTTVGELPTGKAAK